MQRTNRSKLLALAFCAIACLGGSRAATAAEVNMYDGNWHYDLAIYAWLPGISGDINVNVANLPGGGGSGSASVSPSSYIDSLQFAAMLAGGARKGNFAVLSDLDYVDFADLKSRVRNVSLPGGRVTLPLNEDANLGLKALIWTAVGSYTVARSNAGTLDLAAGVRYLGMRTSLDWNYSSPNGVLGRSGGASADINLWDGIVGAYGNIALGESRWYIPYYADIGAGTHSNWSSMAWAGIGYRFDWGNVLLVYKNIYYDQGSGKPLQDLNLGGGALAVTFRW